jgi:precorrin-6Y C5,15-methyltransferase (decarboxylating)
VSAAALAFARLGESWHDASVVSAHGRPLDGAIRELAGARKAAVLTDARNTPAVVAKALLEVGVEDCECWVFEHLGGPDERCIHARLSDVAERDFRKLNVMVVISRQPPVVDQRFGRVESEFGHHAGLVTKAEIRAVSLSKLRLAKDGLLWDVGAGCGSLSIEAAGLMPSGKVYAIERSPEQLELLEANVRSFGRRFRVEIVSGEAPAVLRDLSDPTAVFIGGSGGAIESILEAAYDRVRIGGVVVANFATIEHVAIYTSWCGRRGLVAEVVELQVARSAGIAGLTRFVAQNPVFIASVERSR